MKRDGRVGCGCAGVVLLLAAGTGCFGGGSGGVLPEGGPVDGLVTQDAGSRVVAAQCRSDADCASAGMRCEAGSCVGGASGSGGIGGSGGASALDAGVAFDAGGPVDSGTTGPVDAGGSTGVDAGPFDAGGDGAPGGFTVGDPTRNQVLAGDVCTRLAELQCAGEAACCNAPGRDRAACEQAQRASCVNDLYLDAVSANPAVGFDATAVASTLTELERLASQCDPGILAFGRAALFGNHTGTVEPGASCTVAGLSNEAAAVGLTSCLDPQRYACLPASVLSWSCVARGAPGDPCLTLLNCQDGLYCPNPDLDITGATCVSQKPLGTACSAADECQSLACQAGSCVQPTSQTAYCLAQ